MKGVRNETALGSVGNKRMEEKKSPGKPVETTATNEQLLEHYNAQCPAYNEALRERFPENEARIAELAMAQLSSPDQIGRAELIDRIRKQNLRLGRTIRDRSHELLLDKVRNEDGTIQLKDGKYTVGLTYRAILDKLAIEFPEASTSVACLRWYNVHMKGDAADEGLPFPDLPQYRPRSPSKRAT